MEAGGNIKTGFQGFDNADHPMVGKFAAGIDDTNNHGFYAGFYPFFNRHVRYANISAATFEAQLTQTPLRPPVFDAKGCFCGQLIGGVAEKQ